MNIEIYSYLIRTMFFKYMIVDYIFIHDIPHTYSYQLVDNQTKMYIPYHPTFTHPHIRHLIIKKYQNNVCTDRYKKKRLSREYLTF